MKPREFWIDCAAPEENYAGDAFFEHPRQGPLLWQHCLVHVREVSPELDAAIEKMVEALDSLLELYPPDVFDGSSGDEGPKRIVTARKALDAYRKARG